VGQGATPQALLVLQILAAVAVLVTTQALVELVAQAGQVS
jgi:hypothetical protein